MESYLFVFQERRPWGRCWQWSASRSNKSRTCPRHHFHTRWCDILLLINMPSMFFSSFLLTIYKKTIYKQRVVFVVDMKRWHVNNFTGKFHGGNIGTTMKKVRDEQQQKRTWFPLILHPTSFRRVINKRLSNTRLSPTMTRDIFNIYNKLLQQLISTRIKGLKMAL